MNRSNYKVLVESKKQAKQFKQALLSVGEVIDEDYWIDEHLYPQNELKYLSGCGWLVSSENDLKEITFKELLTLLVTQDQPKSGLLDGKVAIQVQNEREFKLLMEHYDSKGWESCGRDKPEWVTFNNNKPYWSYQDEFGSSIIYHKNNGYSIIPFKDFAAEVNIKVPVFIANSTDGVPIYEGDKYHGISRDYVGKWCYSGFYPIKTNTNIVLGKDPYCKAFSTKQAAEKWIADQNKPKEIKVKLFNKHQSATIRKDSVDVSVNSLVIRLSPSDLEDMLHVYKQAYV